MHQILTSTYVLTHINSSSLSLSTFSLKRLDFCLALPSLTYHHSLIFFLVQWWPQSPTCKLLLFSSAFWSILVLVGFLYFRSTLAYQCLLSLCWFERYPFLCFSDCSGKRSRGLGLDQYKGGGVLNCWNWNTEY